MATNVFELFGRLSLDSNDFEQGLLRAKKQASGFGDLLSGAAKVGIAAIGAASTAVAGFAGASVAAGQDFDKSMSQVAATMGKTTAEIGELRDFAQEMGRTTAFSATQAADALNYMALAGYDAQTSMDMLPNVLNLAAAGSMDLARASNMVTDTQTAFGMSLERTTQLVDEMAKAASTGNTSVEQLGDAFLVVGGLAQELNGGMITLKDGTTATVDGIQEMEIALTAMANAGIKGSEAGTHMRNMIMKLSSPTSDGTKALEAMGITIFDTEGKMRSLAEIFGDLSDTMSEMTQEQKIQTISDLFNARDLSSAEALLNAVNQDWDNIGEAILAAEGAASKMAETQLDNLAGDVTLFESALEGAKIAISDKLTPTLRDFVQFGTTGLSELTDSFTEGGLDAAMEKFGEILSNGITTVIEKSPKIIKAGTKLLTTLIKGFIKNKNQLRDAAHEIMDVILETLGEEFPSLKRYFDEIKSVIDGVFGFIEDNGPLIQGTLEGILAGFIAFKVVSGILTGISTGIELISTAQAVLNGEMALASMVNPYTAIATAVAALVAVTVTLEETEKHEREEYLAGLAKISEEDQARIDRAHQFVDAMMGVYENNKKVTESVDEQYESELALKNELAQIVDANGHIKEGYEERADVIMTQLNEAFDTELEKQGNVITNYDTEIAKIDQVIEKKKAEAILRAGEEEYVQAQKEQVQLSEDMANKLDEYNRVSAEYEETQKRANEALAIWNREGANPEGQAASRLLDELIPKLEEQKIVLERVTTELDASQEAYYRSQDYIKDYDALLEASTTNADGLSEAIKNMTNGLLGQEAPASMLKKQAEEATTELDKLLKAYGRGAAVSEEQIAEATQKAWDAIKEWQDAGGEAVEGYAVKLAESNNVVTNARGLVDDALKALREAQDSHSPSREFGKEGKNAVEGYAKGMDDNFPIVMMTLGKWFPLIEESFAELSAKATVWGNDMIGNFVAGVEAKIPALTGVVAKAAGVVNKNLGFSEPEEGPLSDFHTYAPDMMKLFAEGIDQNGDIVEDAIQRNFDFADTIESADMSGDKAYRNGTASALGQVISLLQELVDKGWVIEGDTGEIFNVVERENKQRTKATGYNPLAAIGG